LFSDAGAEFTASCILLQAGPCQGTASHADDLAYESSHWAGEELYEACHLIDRRDAIERRFRPGSSDRPRASWGFLHLIEAPGASV